MRNIENERLQEIVTGKITSDGNALDGCFATVDTAYALVSMDTLNRLVCDANIKTVSGLGSAKGINDVIRGKYHANGEPVEELYATDDAKLIVATKSFVDKALDMQAQIKRLNAVNSSLQAQIVNNGTALNEKYKVLSKKDAVEKFGDEIISDYLKEHRAELIEELRPEIEASCKVDREAIIQEYLETHKKTYPYLQKANQERSSECVHRTALYLVEFCGGSSQNEIAQKYGVAYSTVHRLLKLDDKSDVDRLMQAYSLHKEIFDGFTEKDVEDCLKGYLNKKTEKLEKKLAAARELIARNTPDDSGDDWGE